MRTAREEENPDVGAKAVAEERSAARDNVIESFIVVSVKDFLFNGNGLGLLLELLGALAVASCVVRWLVWVL